MSSDWVLSHKYYVIFGEDWPHVRGYDEPSCINNERFEWYGK